MASRYHTIINFQKDINEDLNGFETHPAFELPFVDEHKEAVLMWVVDTEVEGQSLNVEINGKFLTNTANLPATAYQTINKVVPTGILKPVGNTVRFTRKGPFGKLRISDVVLFYKDTKA